MSIAQNFVRSAYFRIVETVVNVAIGFLMMPMYLHFLGQDVYGLWIVVVSVTSSFYIFDLGVATAVTRFIATALGRCDQSRANEVVSTALAVYSALAIAILLATAVAAMMSSHFVDEPGQTSLTRLLILITGLTLAIEFPCKAFAGISSFHMRLDIMSACLTTIRVVTALSTYLALRLGHSVVAVATIALAGSLISNLAFVVVARHLEPNLRPSLRSVSATMFRELAGFSSWTFMADSIRILRERGDLWLTAGFLGSTVLTTYYAAVRLVDYSIEFLNSALGMTTPLFAREVSEHGSDRLASRLYLFSRINATAGALVFGGFLAFALPFFTVWVGRTLDPALCAKLTFIVVGARLIAFVTAPMASALTALNAPRLSAYVSAIEAATSITTVAVLLGVMKFGVVATAVGSLVASSVARIAALPWLLSERLEYSPRTYAVSVLGVLARMSPFIVAATWLSHHVLVQPSLLRLVAGAVTYVAIGIVQAFILLSDGEAALLESGVPARPVQLMLHLRRRLRSTAKTLTRRPLDGAAP